MVFRIFAILLTLTSASAFAARGEAPKTGYGKTDRPLGDFLVGPFATVVALPRPISFGVESKYDDTFGLSAAYGFLPQLTISSVKIKVKGWDVRFKWYPWKSSFFVGLGYGSQTFTGSQSQTISGVPVTGTVDQDNTFIAPHVGWNWIWDSGFFMGLDLGAQFSLHRSSNFTTDASGAIQATSQYADLQKSVLDKADQVGKTPLPLVTLLKIGYFF